MKTKLPLSIFFSIGFVFVLIIYFSLNYSGFCFDEFRYLSDYEQYERIFYSANNPRNSYESIEKRVGKKNYTAIPYESFSEYLKLHPDCCYKSRKLMSEERSSQWQDGVWYGAHSFKNRIFGNSTGKTFYIEYHVQYPNKFKQITTYPIRFASSRTNCGKTSKY